MPSMNPTTTELKAPHLEQAHKLHDGVKYVCERLVLPKHRSMAQQNNTRTNC